MPPTQICLTADYLHHQTKREPTITFGLSRSGSDTFAMSRTPASSKRPMKLDLDAPSASKKMLAQQILTSPDVQMLKLTSPELAEFLTRNPSLATPTPNGYMFPKTVTEEQEIYAKGFEVALQDMYKTQQAPPTSVSIDTIERATSAHKQSTTTATTTTIQQPQHTTTTTPKIPSRPSSSASGTYESDNSNLTMQIKEEDFDDDDDEDRDSLGGAVSPIDMETQEKIKLERKRMRNRVAASKCRKRKLERIAQLDDKVKVLKGENVELADVVKKLKASVYNLKQEVMEHVNNGCEILLSDAAVFS